MLRRILTKVIASAREKLGGALKKALYLESGELRSAQEAANAFEAACREAEAAGSVSAAASDKWDAAVDIQVALIREGYLSPIGSNIHREGKAVKKVLHTSGVESTNALLKKLTQRNFGPELGIRIFSFFVIKVTHF